MPNEASAPPAEPPVAPPVEDDSTDRDAVLKATYVVATKRLREAHLDEFNGYRQEEAAKRGVEWTPPLSADQKARADLDRLLAEHPHLVEELASRVEQ